LKILRTQLFLLYFGVGTPGNEPSTSGCCIWKSSRRDGLWTETYVSHHQFEARRTHQEDAGWALFVMRARATFFLFCLVGQQFIYDTTSAAQSQQ
jgi:hypothetical protein